MSERHTNRGDGTLRRTLRFLRRHWTWGIVLVLGYILWQRIHPSIDLPTDGRVAPDLELQAMDGTSFRLSEHRGEVVVLNVWATWCPPCRLEVPGFVELQDEYGRRGVTFVGLSVDENGFDAVQPFAEKHRMNYPQLASLHVAYGDYGTSNSVPRTYVIDKQGRIRYEHVGLLLKGALAPVLDRLVSEPGPKGAS